MFTRMGSFNFQLIKLLVVSSTIEIYGCDCLCGGFPFNIFFRKEKNCLYPYLKKNNNCMKNLISRWKIQRFQQTLFIRKIWDPSKHSSLGSSISSSKISYFTFIFFQHVSLINLKFFNVIKNKKYQIWVKDHSCQNIKEGLTKLQARIQSLRRFYVQLSKK